jgi:glycosyltransferase involved in cell wall biosynthesis
MLSILVVCYNHEKYIKDALGSILNQKLNDSIELIIIDDFSTDNSLQIIKSCLSKTSNVVIISNDKNHGIVKTYQKAFAACNGDLIFVLEGDDFWTNPNKLSMIAEIMKTDNSASMCFHDYQLLNQNNTIINRTVYSELSSRHFIDTVDLIKDSSLIGNFSVCCYRKKYIKQIPESFWENNTNDWGLNLLMSTFGPIRYFNEKMSVYRLHDQSLWTGASTKKKYEYILDIIPYYKTIIGNEFRKDFCELEQKVQNLIFDLNKNETIIKRLKKYIKKIIS